MGLVKTVLFFVLNWSLVSVLRTYLVYLFHVFQTAAPYNKGAFKIELSFPAEYPFKPPKITFKTKIYHPNIDEKGQMCLPIISPDRWKPATKADQGIFCCTIIV